MNLHAPPPDSTERKRRYLVHLVAAQDDNTGRCFYVAHICPWSARPSARVVAKERRFTDECELIETLNPLLPKGSDVRDVMGHVEGPDGFLYLLSLIPSEAALLGWSTM